jgi:DNA invertase Pin-like site-specific DNA recombinase
MPARSIPDPGPPEGAYGGILVLPERLEQHSTVNVVVGCRVSRARGVESGALYRQEQAIRTAIQDAGGKVVAIVGNKRAQRGKLSSGRPDLLSGVALAKSHNAILCFWDILRLFRPAAYDPVTDPDAIHTPEDFAQLWRFVGPGVPLAVIVPPDQTLKELHHLATKRGMKQAEAEGRFPGRSRDYDERIEQLVLCDRHAGLSLGEIAKLRGLTKSTVQRIIDRWSAIASRRRGGG